MSLNTRIKNELTRNSQAFVPVGTHTQNGSLGSVVTLTVPDGANAIIVQARTQDISYTLDGTNPTATLGWLLKTTNEPRLILLPSDDIVLKFIQVTATAVLDYMFVRAYAS